MTAFNRMLNQMEDRLMKDDDIFETDQENPRKLIVKDPNKIFDRELHNHERKMLKTIVDVDQYSWDRGAAGPTTGFDLFDEAIDGGISTFFGLFAAAPNVGKSAFVLQVMKQIAQKNDNVYCEYISLDDSLKVLMPRWIACDQHITISQAKNPERYLDEPEILERRNEGIKKLVKGIDKFKMTDNTEGTSVEWLERHVQDLVMSLEEGTRIVLGIDSFYDLTTEKKCRSDKEEQEHIAKSVKDITTKYDITILATAHLRKLNGNRRPTNEDLKENNRLEFEADLVCLLYNEVGLKEESADVYWLNEDEDLKMPVLEVRLGKNKISDFKGTRFYEMIPSQSFFIEATEEACKRYASLVYQK